MVERRKEGAKGRETHESRKKVENSFFFFFFATFFTSVKKKTNISVLFLIFFQ